MSEGGTHRGHAAIEIVGRVEGVAVGIDCDGELLIGSGRWMVTRAVEVVQWQSVGTEWPSVAMREGLRCNKRISSMRGGLKCNQRISSMRCEALSCSESGSPCSIRSHPKPSEGLRSTQKPSEAIRSHPKQSKAIKSHQKPSEAIRRTRLQRERLAVEREAEQRAQDVEEVIDGVAAFARGGSVAQDCEGAAMNSAGGGRDERGWGGRGREGSKGKVCAARAALRECDEEREEDGEGELDEIAEEINDGQELGPRCGKAKELSSSRAQAARAAKA